MIPVLTSAELKPSSASHALLIGNIVALRVWTVAILLVVVGALAALGYLHHEAQMRVAVATQNLARTLDTSIERLIEKIDISLLACADEIGLQIAAENPDQRLIDKFMLRQYQNLPQAIYLRATNERGDFTYGAGGPAPLANLADRDYFIRLRDDPGAGLTIVKPLVDNITGKWVWPFARRINKADGSFAGIIYLPITLDQVDKLFPRIDLGAADTLALRDADLGLIARLGPLRLGNKVPIGDHRVAAAFRDAYKANPKEGSYNSGETSIDGISRTHYYIKNEKYGFVANVGIADATSLAEWRIQAWIIAGLVLLSGLVLLTFSRLIGRAMQRQEQYVASLRASQKALRDAQDVAQLGAYVYDLRSGHWTSSDILDVIFGIDAHYPRDTAGWLGLVAAESRGEMQDYLASVIAQTLPFDRQYCIVRPSDGQARWVHGKGKFQYDQQGNPSALIGTVQDVTDQRRIEGELQIAATAFESQEGMVITGADETIVRVNKAFSEITGYAAAEVVGRNARILNSGRHDAAFYDAMWNCIARSGSWQGEIWNRRKNGEAYPAWLTITAVKADGHVSHYVGTFADITAPKAAAEEIERLAFYDHLTGLPNRRLMLDRLEQALRRMVRNNRHAALMLIDLDNFKSLNDTLGHAVGDQLLVQVAARLKSSVREGDTVARLGGDEFVVILVDLDATETAAIQAEAVAELLQTELGRPYALEVGTQTKPGKRSHYCTASIGIALLREASVTADELMKRADTAMYQAKKAGRNTLRFFDPRMQALVAARAAMEFDLRNALASGQFLLYYQAQVDLLGGVVGAEVLVRWNSPERGLVLPAEFIPMAEESGLILPLGHWVLETACAQIAAWARCGPMAFLPLTLAVNVSARQFNQPNFVEEVFALMAATGVNPGRLKLELTESLLLENAEDVIAKMTALRAAGIRFSLDDFGTGYSSMSYLKRLPLDQLKIDQSFVRDLLTDSNDDAITKTILALGKSMGLAVIAEGVETQAQRDYLCSIDCQSYQGYYFSRPLPLEGFEALVLRG